MDIVRGIFVDFFKMRYLVLTLPLVENSGKEGGGGGEGVAYNESILVVQGISVLVCMCQMMIMF